MARGKAANPARSGLAQAEYVLRRQVAHDSADALSRIMYIYDEASIGPLRKCVGYLMLPWWKRLFTPKPDFEDVHWYKTPSIESLKAMQVSDPVVAEKEKAREIARIIATP